MSVVTTLYSPRVERVSPFLYTVAGFQVDMRNGRAIACTCQKVYCQHCRVSEQAESIYSEQQMTVSCVVCGYGCRKRPGRTPVCWRCSW